jgi:adenine deaminase
VAIGSSDELLKKAVDALMKSRGGICLVHSNGVEVFTSSHCGLMSDKDGHWVGSRYEELTKLAQQFHSKPKAPFMLLSFMALLVIPALKLSDKGLFNGLDFRFVDLEA